MKRVLAILLGLLLWRSGCALGETAATYILTPLYSAPTAQAEQLMTYRIGVRVEIIRDTGTGFVQVNVGEQGGGLMGYMEMRDLAFSEENIRAFRAERVTYRGAEGQTCKLYSYPDKEAPVIDPEFNITVKEVIGEKDGQWLHVKEFGGGTGFVALDELEGEYAYYEAAPYIAAEPMEHELSREEALVEARYWIAKGKPEIDAQQLELCPAEVDVSYYYKTPGKLVYHIEFRDPDDGQIYANISFLVSGRQIEDVNYGVG